MRPLYIRQIFLSHRWYRRGGTHRLSCATRIEFSNDTLPVQHLQFSLGRPAFGWSRAACAILIALDERTRNQGWEIRLYVTHIRWSDREPSYEHHNILAAHRNH